MSTKRGSKSDADQFDADLLAELFPSSDSSPEYSFDLFSNPSFARLAGSVVALGGMATVYLDRSDNSIGLSIRFGTKRQSYRFAGDDADDVVLDQLANNYHSAYAKRHRIEQKPQK